MEIAVLNLWSSSKTGRVICENNNKCTRPKTETTTSENYYRTKVVLVILMQHCNDHSQTVTYNRKYEQRTNNIYFSILWDLEILGRPSWESTQLASIGKGSLNVPYKVWLIPCHCIMRKVMQCHLSLWCVMYLYVMGQFYLQYSSMIPLVRYGFYLLLIIFFLKKKKTETVGWLKREWRPECSLYSKLFF